MIQSSFVLPAKLSRPSATGLIERQRLFPLLDRFRRRPVTWVEGPPGAGKTSLVSSWVEARGFPCLWYQVDIDDGDPAGFFHYLRQAARSGVASSVPLPAFTPEALPDLAGFTHRFFVTLLQRMPSLALIVLDNFQEAGDDSPFATLAQEVSTILPEGVTLVVTSRLSPPAAFARAVAHADVARLTWDDLRLDADETRLMARLDSASDGKRARFLHERTSGWAAGLRLMLESGTGAVAMPTGTEETPEALFEYLALEVFDRSPSELRELWLATANLPRFTAAMADVLTGQQGTVELLERVAKQRYFIERRAAPAMTYQYHALFGEFLRRQVKRHRDEATQRLMAHRSAALLAETGEEESAFRLYCEAADFEAAIPLILREAPALLAQGRWKTLQASLETLPDSLLDEVPWLAFWLGSARAMIDPPLARQTLERAHWRFVESADLAGQAMCIAAVIDTHFFEGNHLAQLDSWIDAAERLIVSRVPFPALASELRFWSSLLVALMHCQPSSLLASVVVNRTLELLELLELDVGANEKLAAGAHLLYYLSFSGDLRAARQLAEALKPLLGREELTPLTRLSTYSALMMEAFHGDDSTRALDLNRQAQQIIRDNGLGFANCITRLFEVWALAHQGDFEAASALLEEIAPLLERAGPNEVGLSHFLKSWFALLRHDSRAALHHAELAAHTIAGRETFGPVVCCNCAMALSAAACGDMSRAQEAINRNRVRIEGQERGALRVLALLVEADVLLRCGRGAKGREALSEALATARRTDSLHACIWLPDMWGRLCAEALRAGIETDVATRLIVSRGLLSPSADLEAWPWPIRIHTLGRFEVLVNGEVVRHVHKAQRRVLDLLKALVALGAEGVSRAAIAGALWPDSEGDAARDAFGVTLHRLRKLLGREDAIVLSHGQLKINTAIVWTDSLVFERLAIQAGGDGAAFSIDTGQRALALYAGPFLDNEEDAPWLLPTRERLRSRYVRLVLSAAQHFESDDRPDLSVGLYQTALEAEPLAEEVYRRLMACLVSQGRHTEALDVYRRCRRMLSVVLGVTPSRTTQELHQSIERAD